MKNQTGNITSLGLVIMLSLISIGSILIVRKMNDIKRHSRVFQNFLCTKEAHGLLREHKNFIEITNNIIKVSNLGQMVGLFTNPSVLLTAKKAKLLTQRTQNIYHFSFLNNISSLFRRSCLFSPGIAKTHFETTTMFKLSRDHYGVVKQRRGNWNFSSINQDSQINSQVNAKKMKTSAIFY
jgi:hypothetical protein